jgi:hypothetical protein
MLRFSFSLLGCYIYFSMISLLPLPQLLLSVVFVMLICVCKSKTLFLISQMFLKENLKFFLTLIPYFHSTPLLLRFPFTGLQRYKSFIPSQIFLIKFKRIVLICLS